VSPEATASDERVVDLADRVLELVGDRAEAEVIVNAGLNGLTRFANSVIHQHVAEDSVDVHLRVAANGRVASATTKRVDPEGLQRVVDTAITAAGLRPPDPDWPGLSPPAAAADCDHFDADTADAPPDRRAEVVAAFVGAGTGLSAAGYCDSSGSAMAFANSAGQRLQGRVSSATLEAIHQTPTSAANAIQSAVRLADLDGATAGARAASAARRTADAVEVEPGPWEVIVSPHCVASILSFLACDGFNAKVHAEGRSFARVGERQFDASIDIWDDALDPEGIGFAFDAEGTPKRRLDLVSEGVTMGLAHDRRTAAKVGVESTGHALPGAEAFGAIPADMVLRPGNKSVDELIASVERGLLVTELHYTRILDPKTQVVTGLTRNGTFLVEKGAINGGVRDLRFTQSFVDALGPGSVLGVGSDVALLSSEGGGWFRVPSLHLASWNFTGGARG